MGFFRERNCYLKDYNLSFKDKCKRFSFIFTFYIFCVVGIGLGILYSVGGGNWSPWALKQLMRFLLGLALYLIIAFTNLRMWMKYAYWIYGITLALLVGVEVMGTIGMGAQRWLDLGVFQLQPSELMKITLILALARYFHGAGLEDIRTIRSALIPIGMILVPTALILKQPDLGTALMLIFAGSMMLFLAGVQIWKFICVGILGATSVPILWSFLHDYQKQRVLTFLNPEKDPLGAGYHIMQSKIALGSGGLWGKGFLEGTQSRLNFLPEKQTDFIFTVLSEEFGFVGSMILLALFALIILYGFIITVRCTNFFGKFLAFGLTANFALYIFINVGMVMGLLPVVGVPLPLVSYGGTAMLTLMMGFGLIQCVHINSDMEIGRRGSIDDE